MHQAVIVESCESLSLPGNRQRLGTVSSPDIKTNVCTNIGDKGLVHHIPACYLLQRVNGCKGIHREDIAT